MEPNTDTDFQLIGLPRIVDESSLRSRAPFEVLASQFVDEIRRGERPSIELYARRFPPHAERIRECFPVLRLLEQARIEKESASFRHNMPEKFPFSSLGQCELLCELGRGGMGIVFQARDIGSGHLVAVKVLPWRVSIVPEWRQRFEREARTAALLRHRNIVPVFRCGTENGYCFYVMQFVNGIGLDQIIARLRDSDGVICDEELRRIERTRPDGFIMPRRNPEAESDQILNPGDGRSVSRQKLTRSSWQSFSRIAVQAAQALRSAHGSGVLHNDIKPANLLMDIDGRVWMTDFGLSQVVGSHLHSPAQTSAGNSGVDIGSNDSSSFDSRPLSQILASAASGTGLQKSRDTPRLAGTLRYMAPERLMGEIPDARSDLYSLGITLYELVTQQPAFAELNTEALIRAVLDEPPRAPRAICPQIPRGLETIVMNCIAPDPRQRYQSADQLLTDLLKFCAGDRVTSTRTSAVVGLVRSIGKKFRHTP